MKRKWQQGQEEGSSRPIKKCTRQVGSPTDTSMLDCDSLCMHGLGPASTQVGSPIFPLMKSTLVNSYSVNGSLRVVPEQPHVHK